MLDRFHMFYEILNFKHPKGYRNAKGQRTANRLMKMSDEELEQELIKCMKKAGML